ncbi:MAG: STAS domain-containing protein [candidate division Zixibacteria bacterium]|nr:STAS domain-containing protein [candidate division Zixibacteria bacterium]
MEIQVNEEGKTKILSLEGKLDLANAAKLKESVIALLNEGKTQIHLNMKQVDFINSSGLGALVSLMKEVRVHKGRLTLSDLAPYVNEIFEITQLSHVFEIYKTNDEALASYNTVMTD